MSIEQEAVSGPEAKVGNLSKADWQTYKKIVNGVATGLPELDEAGAATETEVANVRSSRIVPRLSLTPNPSLTSRVGNGNALLDQLKLRSLLRNDETPSDGKCLLYVLPSSTARTTTLIFGGNNRRHFVLPVELLVQHDTNLVLMRDPKRCFCLAGLPHLGMTYDKTVVNLQRLAKILGGHPLFCMGVSAGGSAALKFGCDLHADGVLGFSVPTTLDLADDPGAELRHYPQLAKLYRYDRAQAIDLAKYYRNQVPRPAVTMVYSAGHVRDRWLAERMLGLNGVELVETIDYSGHNTYRWCNVEDKLGALLTKMFASRPLQTLDASAPSPRPARPDDLDRRAKTALDRKAAKAAEAAPAGQ